MENSFRETWTSGSIRPVGLEMKADNQGGLIQLDFSMSGISQHRIVFDNAEFKSFVAALQRFDSCIPFEKLPPGELDPRD